MTRQDIDEAEREYAAACNRMDIARMRGVLRHVFASLSDAEVRAVADAYLARGGAIVGKRGPAFTRG